MISFRLSLFFLYILLNIPTIVINSRSIILDTGLLKTYISAEGPKYSKNNNTYKLHQYSKNNSVHNRSRKRTNAGVKNRNARVKNSNSKEWKGDRNGYQKLWEWHKSETQAMFVTIAFTYPFWVNVGVRVPPR